MGEGAEGGVEDAVDEAGVCADEGADWGEEDLPGTDEIFVAQFLEGGFPFFVRGVEGVVA